MKYRAVIFDLDGTLLNTLGDLADSVNAVLRENHMPCRTIEEVQAFVGNGVAALVRRALPVGTERETQERCLARFKEYYAEHMAEKTAPYEGILPLLDRLKAEGYGIAVVSNKFDGAVRSLCRHYFGARVDVAVGESETRRAKPAPDSVLHAMQTLGVAPEECVYVGDSDVDIQTAAYAGIACISVCWGFRSRDQLKQAGATHTASTLPELYRLLT